VLAVQEQGAPAGDGGPTPNAVSAGDRRSGLWSSRAHRVELQRSPLGAVAGWERSPVPPLPRRSVAASDLHLDPAGADGQHRWGGRLRCAERR
jgi:hypothetical protein